jgi:hypothetical protein
MNMQEDYVSFETAKLLREKGFNEKVICYYDDGGSLNLNKFVEFQCCNQGYGSGIFAAPTLQMAIKWLRIEHNLSVEVYRTACGYIGCIVNIPSGTDIKFLEEDGDDLSSGQYTKWEYACEAAIKYCLENLI